MDVTFYLSAILISLVLSAFFSGSETALMRLSEDELDADPSISGPSKTSAKELTKSTSHLLVTILLGNNLVNIFGTACASSVAVYLFGPKLGLTIATVAMTVLVLVFSEIIPKAVSATSPGRVTNIVAIPLYLVHKIATPIHFLFDRYLDPLIKKMVGEDQGKDVPSVESLLRLAKKIKSGRPAPSPAAIIGAAAQAEQVNAADIMVARTNILAVPATIGVEELFMKILEARYTRIPVYEQSLDTIKGLVHFKDVVRISSDKTASLLQIVKPILKIPERTPILKLFRQMQQSSIHMAVVKDEFGVTQGLLTLEDILEELVGEIRDEFDQEELLAIQRVSEAEFNVLAKVSVHDFQRETGWKIVAQPGDTIGGLVFQLLGRPARPGDTVQQGRVHFVVEAVSGTRIGRVKATWEKDK